MELKERALLRLRGAEGTQIVGTAGSLWVTAEGDPVDYFIEPGQPHRITGQGLVVIEALVPSRLALRPAPAHSPITARRWAGFGAPGR